ncbi:MAG: FliM/FliN family flagellar motor switch protein [Spirochaetes bacterium]|nr:FliM/FliN family flagellar motor switch protein [Spirochaetota bacterium]
MKLESIAKIGIPVEVVLGDSCLSVDQIAKIGEGSIIRLDSIAGEPVEFRAAGEKIALGEVIIIEDNFGIRITRILTGEEDE